MSAARSHLSPRQVRASADRPGGHSAKNARQAGAPTTQLSSQETPIMLRRCRPHSGWLVHNPQSRKPFCVEEVHFL